MHFRVVANGTPTAPGTILLDLDTTLTIDTVWVQGTMATFQRAKGRQFYVSLPKAYPVGATLAISVAYHGSPRMAENPPWDGGLVWKKDSLNRPWLTVACQGIGASTWWPLKDDLADEPDSGVTLHYIVPQALRAVGNGRLVSEEAATPGLKHYTYRVQSPINPYNVTMYVGHYLLAQQPPIQTGRHGITDFSLAVLDYHMARYAPYLDAEGRRTIEIFSDLFGPYPFKEDGYKLVETPYWGMEHQSAVAYGNNLKRNFLGFDFIVVHESGHEWWGNQISVANDAHLWVHEAFCTYAEVLFVEKWIGPAAARTYMKKYVLPRITNQGNLVGNEDNLPIDQPSDIYFRGAWLVDYFRQQLQVEKGEAGDALFFRTLRELLLRHQNKPATTESVLAVIADVAGKQSETIFRQYLYKNERPRLVYTMAPGLPHKVSYKLEGVMPGFAPYTKIKINGRTLHLRPSNNWQTMVLGQPLQEFEVEDPQPFSMVKKLVINK